MLLLVRRVDLRMSTRKKEKISFIPSPPLLIMPEVTLIKCTYEIGRRVLLPTKVKKINQIIN